MCCRQRQHLRDEIKSVRTLLAQRGGKFTNPSIFGPAEGPRSSSSTGRTHVKELRLHEGDIVNHKQLC